jgi:DnaK suppressor protein
MKKTIAKKIKKQLVEDRVQLAQKKADLEVDLSGDQTDEIQGKAILLVNTQLSIRDRARLALIDVALERIEKGTFGTCCECDEDIAEGRLLAYPHVETCFDCAEQNEKLAKQEARR